MQFVGEIFTIAHFQAIVSNERRLSGGPVADPFVVAKAIQAVLSHRSHIGLRPPESRTFVNTLASTAPTLRDSWRERAGASDS